MDNLNDLQNQLIQGQKLSMQGSYQRRAPAKKAIPYLLSARKGLKEYVKQNADNALAWRLLSQAEEYLLNYNAALYSLEKAIELEGKDRKDLKRLAMLKEYGGQWNELNMSSEQLESLGAYLEKKIESYGCDHTLTYTKEWLDSNIPKGKKSKAIKAIQNQGGFCDCEVLMNVID
jgi:tetratricopeptide (TPR) repeat protein